MKTIKINGYKVTIEDKTGNGSHNKWVKVFKGKDKLPTAGTVFQDETKLSVILYWAEQMIKGTATICHLF